MVNGVTLATRNDKQISESIKSYFIKFYISSFLKTANDYKKRGPPVVENLQYLFVLIFLTETSI